jgi:hypothetical protein
MKTKKQKGGQTTLSHGISSLWTKGKAMLINLLKWIKPGLTVNNLISIAALVIAICSFSKANKQFKINSDQSETLFNIQMEKAEKQLKITDCLFRGN